MLWIVSTVFSVIIFVVVIGIITIAGIKSKGDGTPSDKQSLAPNERAGKVAENVINSYLKSLLQDDEYLLTNILLPLKNGYTTEIDAVMITYRGIFCIETKYWVGHISGSDEDEYWYQKYDDPYRKDRKHRNPVLQNEGHCGKLERILKNQYEVDNIVIFAALEDGAGIYSKYAFTYRQFANYYQSLEIELDENVIKTIYNTLVKYVATKEQLDEHKRRIHTKYSD